MIMISEIRLKVKDKLANTSNTNLLDLFVDRTSIDTSFRRFMGVNKDNPRYDNCLCLNDEKTIKFHQSLKQDNDVYDEKRQIWVGGTVDLVEDDLFIPRDDVND